MRPGATPRRRDAVRLDGPEKTAQTKTAQTKMAPKIMKALPMSDLRPLALGLAALLVSPAALASPELARSKNCVACHSAERRMIGPPYRAIAERHANDGTAIEVLSERIRLGSRGVWGAMPMPPQPGVTPEEAEALARWIMSHR